MADVADLEAKIKARGDEVRRLKSSGAPKADIEAAVKVLLDLKSQLPDKGSDTAAQGASVEEQKRKNKEAAAAAQAAARARKKEAKEAKGKAKGNGDAAPAKGAAPGNQADGIGRGPPAVPPDVPARANATPAAGGTGGGADGPKVAQSSKDMIIRHHATTPPALAFAAAKLAGATVHFQPRTVEGVVCALPGGAGEIHGDAEIARHLAKAAPAWKGVYGASGDLADTAGGADRAGAPAVDRWVSKGASLGAAGADALTELNAHLAMRTYVVWHEPSVADAAVFAGLAVHRTWAGIKGSPHAAQAYPHLARWHAHLSAHPVFSALETAYLGGARKGGSFNIELPGAEEGKVVTRFPPEPSGFLHIGHAKAALLNEYFASEYKGKLILRFDDTNPSKEKGEYEEAIEQDVERLGLHPYMVSHTSDYFRQLVDCQTDMLKRGVCFVDPDAQAVHKDQRAARKPSPHRDAALDENLRLWDEMLRGTELGQQCCVRAKMDYASENGTLRDPTTYRCNLTPHHSTGTAFKVYPTYDFACPFVDALEGVTHALRDRQYKDRDAQYHFMAELQGVRRVELWSFSRINFKQCLLSKRKLQWFVDTGRVTGWDDPRMPTIQGILRRGLSVDGLRTYILLQGASQNINLMEWDKIWAENRKIIDPRAKRYTAITEAAAVPLRLTGAEAAGQLPSKPQARSLLAHKKSPELGDKLKWFASTVILDQEDAATLQEGEEVTLMDWGNVIIDRVVRDPGSGAVSECNGRLHLSGSVRVTKKKLTWLAEGVDNVKVELVDLDHLINKDSLEEEDKMVDGADFINEHTLEKHTAIGEPGLRLLQRGQIIQVERRGFYICDAPYVRPGSPVVLYFVPDGKNMYGYRKPQGRQG